MSDTVTENTILDEVRAFIVENFLFGNENDMTAPEESFMANGVIDSLGILELIEFCESTYSISISDDEILPENLDSLNNISSFILRKKA